MDPQRLVTQALRKLLKNPFFTSISILTLALGIGANSAIFSVVNTVLLRPLPYPDAERLVTVEHTAPGLNFPRVEQSDGTYMLYRRNATVFEEIGIYDQGTANLLGGAAPERIAIASVTPSSLRALGVAPRVGRIFTEEEERPGAEPVTVLSHALAARRFGDPAQALGQKVLVNSVARTVVGVMPAHFRFPSAELKLWLPFEVDPQNLRIANFSYSGIARLRPGVTPEQATAEVSALVLRLPEGHPGTMTRAMLESVGFAGTVQPLKATVVGDISRVLWVLLGSVGFLLLIACANVANLFLVRAESRQRELALRSALGATRSQLLGVFLSETLLLAIAGGLAGLGMAFVGLRALAAFGPQDLPRLEELTIDANVLAFTAAVALFAGLLFGALPALRSIPQVATALREGGRGTSGSHGRRRVRHALVIGQVALALVLLVGSGLMVRSFQALRNVDPGFEAQDILSLRISVPSTDYPTPRDRAAFFQKALARIRALPGVDRAGAITILPLSGDDGNSAHLLEDFPLAPDEVPPILSMRYVTPGYFETMGIPLLAGRVFERADHEEMRPYVVVSDRLASRFWGEVIPLEKRLTSSIPDPGTEVESWSTIVGVVGSVRDQGLEAEPEAALYYPILVEDSDSGPIAPNSLTFVVKSRLEPGALLGAIRGAVSSIDPNLPLAEVRTVEEVRRAASARTAFTMDLLLIASVVALLLGAVGLYGVISHLVSQRTQEIGVRMALGARRGGVTAMVLRQGVGLAAGGVVLGLAGAAGLSRLLESFLFGVSATDPLTYGAVSAILVLMAVAASLLPAQKAASVDPIVALRHE